MNAPIAPVDFSDRLQQLQETVSASKLGTFFQCRLKYFFRYVLKLRKAKTAALHVGGTIHGTLKAWNKARWKNQPLTTTQLHQEFAKMWAEQEEEPVTWEIGEEKEQQATAWRLLETYIRESPINAAEKPDAVEVPVETDLSAHGGVTGSG